MVKVKKEYCEELRGKICILREEGYSYRKIASRLKISESGVRYALQRLHGIGSNSDRSRSGRPRVTSRQEDTFIVVSSKRNRKIPATILTAELNKTRVKPVSTDTVKRRLRSVNLIGRVAARKPLLRAVNKKKRLEWAKMHKNWGLEDWKKVLWTDESRFELFGTRRRVHVRRLPNERVLPQCIQSTVKHGGGNIMLWGCFGNGLTGDLVKITSTMDKHMYHNILVKHAIPSGIRIIGKGFIMQQDNDPKHASGLCKNYLKLKERGKVCKIMNWPPQSPDLSPIEKLWDELDRKIREAGETSFINQQMLWERLQKAWNEITAETMKKLLARMPRLCAAVIRSKGSHIDENKI